MERQLFGGGGHHPIWLYEKMVYQPEKIFKLGFVRNPYDRFVSAFFHGYEGKPNPHARWPRTIDGFREFVKTLPSKNLRGPRLAYPTIMDWQLHHHFIPQWFFLTVTNDKIGVDFVGHYEKLQADWYAVLDRLGIPRDPLPHHRKSEHLSYEAYYDDECYQIVGRIYDRDFRLFDYLRIG